MTISPLWQAASNLPPETNIPARPSPVSPAEYEHAVTLGFQVVKLAYAQTNRFLFDSLPWKLCHSHKAAQPATNRNIRGNCYASKTSICAGAIPARVRISSGMCRHCQC